MTYTTIAVIYNPKSTGPSKSMAEEFRTEIQKRLPKQKVELMPTKHAGHAEELAYSIAKASENPLVISASGDGGYNEVVNGAMRAQAEGRKVTTGVLPAGNANDHFRNLNSEDLVELLVKNKSRKIDLLKITGTSRKKKIERYAHSYIGIGLTPKVGKELNKADLHFFSELWIVVRSLFTVKPVRLKLGNKVRYYESVVFSNVDEMSKYLKISRSSSLTDGKFEVTIFRSRNKLRLILVLLRASFAGVVEDSKVRQFKFATVDKTLVQVDGEIVELDAGTDAVVDAERQVLSCVI